MRKIFATFILIFALSSCGKQAEQASEKGIRHFPLQNISINGEKSEEKAIFFNNNAYIELKALFEAFSYDVLQQGSKFVFTKGNEIISYDENKNFILKSDLKISVSDRIVKIGETQYVSSSLAEELLPISFLVENGELLLKSLLHDDYGWKKHKVVGHAFGSIDGKLETCSLEAFEYNYQNGFRLFECDFILTSDGFLVARHDWSNWLYSKFFQELPENDNEAAVSLAEIKSKPIFNNYTTVDFRDVAELMSRHKDFYLITDTKETDAALVKQQFEIIVKTALEVDPEILDRIIPQFYNEEMFFVIDEIYDFRSKIFTVYQIENSPKDVLKFCKAESVKVVAMHYERAKPDYINLLKENGIAVYVHTVNLVERMNLYADLGVDGFYTDTILPRYFELERGQ